MPMVFDEHTCRATKTPLFIRNPTTVCLSALEWLLTFFDTRNDILLLYTQRRKPKTRAETLLSAYALSFIFIDCVANVDGLSAAQG